MSGCRMVDHVRISNSVQISNGRPFLDKMAAILSITIQNPTPKMSGFQMIPDFEWSDFRSPLYSLIICAQILPQFYLLSPVKFAQAIGPNPVKFLHKK